MSNPGISGVPGFKVVGKFVDLFENLFVNKIVLPSSWLFGLMARLADIAIT
jgi:hypothetical protein